MRLSKQEHWSGSQSLLQGIFPTQGSSTSVPPAQQVSLLPLKHLGSQRMLKNQDNNPKGKKKGGGGGFGRISHRKMERR